MKIGLFGRVDIPLSINIMKEVIKILRSRGTDVIPEKSVASSIGLKDGVTLADMDVDVLITVGGDGTILRAALFVDAPILSIKVGNVGFLTELQINEIEDGLERLLRGKYYIEEREKLRVSWNGHEYFVTNEIAVKGGRINKLNKFLLEIEDEGEHLYRCDGVVISTPTGSTGYASSLGGPILHHALSAIVITPIAPFRDVLRSLVIPNTKKVRIKVMEEWWHLVLDGQISQEFHEPGDVEVVGGGKTLKLIRFKKVMFLEDLNKKFYI